MAAAVIAHNRRNSGQSNDNGSVLQWCGSPQGETDFLISNKSRERSFAEPAKEKIEMFLDRDDPATRAVKKIQHLFRKRRYPERLHRKNLCQRLKFESQLLRDAARFLNQIIVFALFITALRLSSNEVAKRSIFQMVDGAFDLEGLRDIGSRGDFVQNGMPSMAEASKPFFVLSNHYFEDIEGKGSVQLLGDVKVFDQYEVGAPIILAVENFTLSAWVRTNKQFVGGNILRKRPVRSGAGSELSCWGWFLHSHWGPELKYGAHDTFSLVDERERVIMLEEPAPFPPDTYAMVTLVVEGLEVTFYHDLDKLGSRQLEIPITDCYNDEEGMLLGDPGLELGVIRFYPQALDPSSISELFSAGDTLKDVSTGSRPQDKIDTETEVMGRTIITGIDSLSQGISHTKLEMDIVQLLQTVDGSVDSLLRSPAAPFGTISAAQSPQKDPYNSTAREYYQIVMGPYLLTSTRTEAEHRSVSDLPDFTGTGSTASFWYRHQPCSQGKTCGVYLFTARDPDANNKICWSLWLEDYGIWFDTGADTPPPDQYPLFFVQDKYLLSGDRVWRHLAIVLDENSDEFQFYMDGHLAWKGAYGSAVSQTDCNPGAKFLTLGRSFPSYTYGAEVEIYDFRLYVHPSGSPLTAREIAAIASEPTPHPALPDTTKCNSIESDTMMDTDWIDVYEHNCAWYNSKKSAYPKLCKYEKAALNCPNSCSSRQECLAPQAEVKTYLTWDRIRRIESRSSNGTVCLSDQRSKSAVVEECKTWVANGWDTDHEAIRAWLNSMDTSAAVGGFARSGRRIDLRLCEELEESIDEHCSFNSTAVQQFTQDVKDNGGDYTIAFWIRPLGLSSLLEGSERFFPHINFMSSLSPPQHNLIFGLWGNPNGESRSFSSCGDASNQIFTNVEMRAASNSDWTFLAIARKNSSDGGEWAVATNLERNFEGGEFKQCLYDSEMFFSALEVNYPSLMSPIMMIPRYMPFAEIQQQYLKQTQAMGIRNGPLLSAAERDENSFIPIEKHDYVPRTALLAPPLLFQTRSGRDTACNFEYSQKYIQVQHDRAVQSLCAQPFQCDCSVIESAGMTFSCPGDTILTEKQFDLDPLVWLQGRIGYADFLQSVTSNPFLFRGGSIVATDSFIDSQTEDAEIFFVFFTPQMGMTSVLQVRAEFPKASSVSVSTRLRHFQILEGQQLTVYLIVQSVVILNISLMLIDIFLHIKDFFVNLAHKELPSAEFVVKLATDLATALMVLVFIVFRIRQMTSSAEQTEKILGGLLNVPWEQREIPLVQKKELFFEKTKDLLSLMDDEESLSNFCNVILLVHLLRVIQLTGLHPRLSLLTGTIAKSLDDLWHATLLTVLMLACFGSLAVWRFGSEREEFSDFVRAFQTQFEMMFGEFPENWTESVPLQMYTVAYILCVFLLVQNFLLAIVVEAYMGVREENEENEIEQGFFTDLIACVASPLRAYYERWPKPDTLAACMDDWTARYSVGYRELYSSGLFVDHSSAGKYLKLWSRLEFLQPEEIAQYGRTKDKNPQEKMVDELELRIAKLLKIPAPTLKNLALKSEETIVRKRSMSSRSRVGSWVVDEFPVVNTASQDTKQAVCTPGLPLQAKNLRSSAESVSFSPTHSSFTIDRKFSEGEKAQDIHLLSPALEPSSKKYGSHRSGSSSNGSVDEGKRRSKADRNPTADPLAQTVVNNSRGHVVADVGYANVFRVSDWMGKSPQQNGMTMQGSLILPEYQEYGPAQTLKQVSSSKHQRNNIFVDLPADSFEASPEKPPSAPDSASTPRGSRLISVLPQQSTNKNSGPNNFSQRWPGSSDIPNSEPLPPRRNPSAGQERREVVHP